MAQIYCKNLDACIQAEPGTSLADIARREHIVIHDPFTGKDYKPLAAQVNRRLKALEYHIPTVVHEINFIGLNHPDGRRAYNRSLCFVLQKAVRDLWPDRLLQVLHSLPSGLYCEMVHPDRTAERRRPYPVTGDDLVRLRARMQEIIDADFPFVREKVDAETAKQVFRAQHQLQKADILDSVGKFVTSLYHLDDAVDTFYGTLVPSSGYIDTFGLVELGDGFCLQLPDVRGALLPINRDSKIAATLLENADWCDIIGARGVCSLNKGIQKGMSTQIINVAEALHERKYAEIANQIYARRDRTRIVFIAGPSSSGKTTSSLRIALQCKVLGLNPQVIELDNYFLNREQTPKDEFGEYDFESLYALDLDFLGAQLNALLAGEEVEIPKFNFKTGTRSGSGRKMRLGEKDILIMEGIHALNPAMTPGIDNDRIFRIYVSALTSLTLDENNSLSTSDNRLLRRIVRDNRVRGITPEDTILRWNSVRRGETRNIFPFQENADAMFNSSLIFELPMLKYYAEPLLRRISPQSPAYPESLRLLHFLDFVVALQPSEIAAIPPTSIMREFIGGQTLGKE